MKTMKKLFAILLAVVMVMGLAMSASAYTITVNGDTDSPTTNHVYEVYQIYTGTLNENTLSDIKYGVNYGETGTLVPETELEGITDDNADTDDAREFAQKLTDGNANNGEIKGSAIATLNSVNNWTADQMTVQGDDPATADVTEESYEIDIPAGYYLIKDVSTGLPDGDAKSAYIVQVVKNVEVVTKSETTTSDKVITSDDYADNNGDGDSVTTDGKTSNGAVGSTVDFSLTVNVPNNASGYSYYYCVLNDALSEGLTFVPTSVVVKVGNDALSSNTDENTEKNDYALYTGNDAGGKTFQIAMLDAKSLAGKTITVTYSATINENAVIGVAGNPNIFDVTYSNDPEHDYADKNNNGKPDDETNTPTGSTPDKTTRTYVTGVKLIKVDEDGNVLTGAEFEITGSSVKYVLTAVETFVEDTTEAAIYWKLKNETYTTEAPRTEDQYVAKTDRDGGYVADATTEGGYREATAEELAGDVQLYTKLLANADSYASTEIKYKKTIEYTVKGDDEGENTKTLVGADGVVYFSGLGEGVYTIKETKTPAGYNTIADITLTIDWTAPTNYPTNTNCTWSATASNVTGDLTLNNEGVFELEIVNKQGSNLPETGGMGTTLFYVCGTILVLAAGVLLITKKRMGAAE